MRKKGYLVIIFILGIVLMLIIGFVQEQSAKATIISLGVALAENNTEKATNFFTKDATLIYGNKKIPLNEALNRLHYKMVQKVAFVDIYVYKAKRINFNMYQITTTSWLKFDKKSYEDHAIAEVKNVGFNNWRITKLTSNTPVFRNIFFE